MKGSRDMNTPSEPNAQDTRPQVDEQRRRLTKGGLVAPVVIGTLLSRPVLGAAPYNCTISGQISGNVSAHGPDQSCILGDAPSTWAALSTWPSPYTPGTQFNATTSYGAFANAYRRKTEAGTTYLVNTSATGTQPATLKDVLTLPASSSNPPPNPELGKAAVASLLNAVKYAPDYPLTPGQVIEMFNATYNGGTYNVNGTVLWNAATVLAYFKSLMPPY